VRLRLAGILLDEGNYDEALKLAEADHGEAFAALYADIKGDILAAAGKPEEARAAYQAALARMNKKGAYHQIVQMKLDSLGDAR
jgi:predicted negative regulator of RcsB-dependent stress response